MGSMVLGTHTTRDGHIPAWSQMQWFGFISLPWLQTVPRDRISKPLIDPGFHVCSSDTSAFLILPICTQNSRTKRWECHRISGEWKESSWRDGTWLNHLCNNTSNCFSIWNRQTGNICSNTEAVHKPDRHLWLRSATWKVHSEASNTSDIFQATKPILSLRNDTVELWRSIRWASTNWECLTSSREALQTQ